MDFLKADYIGADKIIMNPPFTRQQDADHILQAYDMLGESGILVSVCSVGPFFRNNRKSIEFREFLESVDAEVFDLPEGAFKESGTMIATKIIRIRKQEVEQLGNIQQELRQAKQNFDYAEDEFIDVAIYGLKAAEEKFSAMLREKRDEK